MMFISKLNIERGDIASRESILIPKISALLKSKNTDEESGDNEWFWLDDRVNCASIAVD